MSTGPKNWNAGAYARECATESAAYRAAINVESRRNGQSAESPGREPGSDDPEDDEGRWQLVEQQAGEAAAKNNGIVPPYDLRPLASAEFFDANFRHEWDIRRILVRRQPCLIAGPKKSLKTSIAIDMVLSLGTATHFLGEFNVYRRRRVLFVSGESGEATIQETGLRIAAAESMTERGK